MINFKLVVSLAVCEIFSVKEWRDFENQVRGRSRSSETAPFDRSHTSSYSPLIVTLLMTVVVLVVVVQYTLYNIAYIYRHAYTYRKWQIKQER